eukprot:Rhum_TRINITY_DN14511_c1_g1::Rhum_TRINITY_DN14511_c1_g1_i1::g.93710::m.93710/K00833/bioA; adenosylmethionine---8-amino-7-oxononanoate aminotransferase
MFGFTGTTGRLARSLRRYGVVVYGANTEVGKSVVSGGLVRAAAASDVRCHYVKPVQTGPSTDEAWLRRYAPEGQRIDTLYAYSEPLSPHLAAELDEGSHVPPDAELAARVAATLDVGDEELLTVVETAGGVLSPAPSGTPQADVYKTLDARALLVGDPALGGISATLCALESMAARGVTPAAVLFVGGASNAEAIRDKVGGVPVVCLPALPPADQPLHEWYGESAEAFAGVVRRLLPDAVFDRRHIWHPYTSMAKPGPTWHVASASGVRVTLRDGRELVDGMASWWSAIHGYNVPALNQAASGQLEAMSHVMFGGLRHTPAVDLCRSLVELTPPGLECVFLADSGSVSVEAAMKMAIQYWVGRGRPQKKKFVTIRNGYHGDTFGAMSVCDPVNSMHTLYTGVLMEQVFIESLDELEAMLTEKGDEIAALILEPIVQGAGGMRFYAPEKLAQARALCTAKDVLLVADEIATGFGRTGEMFACNHAGVTPDIMCVGKALTGGYMTLAAAIATRHVANTVSGDDGTLPFMHGPTFMGNPLACSVASASLKLLAASPWQQRVKNIERVLTEGLEPARAFDTVADVRVMGAIGVIELKEAPKVPANLQRALVDKGVWVRPFGRLVYVMPPYVMEDSDLNLLAAAMVDVAKESF